MAGRFEPLVDYERNAGRYTQGRELAPEQLDRWRTAVAARLPGTTLQLVLDVGAGTGIFLPMWASLGATRILAVEPSPAMRAAATERAVAAADVVAGDLVALPLRSATADLLWLSAVLHHVADRRGAFAELARVVHPRGRILIRGFVPGASRVPWLEHLPGAERAKQRFPSVEELGELATATGLRIVGVDTVDDPAPVRPAAAAEWITLMRGADSLLTALTDDEIATGVDSLRALPDEPIGHVALALITISR